jgi:hypothetical protein
MSRPALLPLMPSERGVAGVDAPHPLPRKPARPRAEILRDLGRARPGRARRLPRDLPGVPRWHREAIRQVRPVPPENRDRPQMRPAAPQEQGHSRYRGPLARRRSEDSRGRRVSALRGPGNLTLLHCFGRFLGPPGVRTMAMRTPYVNLVAEGRSAPRGGRKRHRLTRTLSVDRPGFFASSRQKGTRLAITPRCDRLERPVSPREPSDGESIARARVVASWGVLRPLVGLANPYRSARVP